MKKKNETQRRKWNFWGDTQAYADVHGDKRRRLFAPTHRTTHTCFWRKGRENASSETCHSHAQFFCTGYSRLETAVRSMDLHTREQIRRMCDFSAGERFEIWVYTDLSSEFAPRESRILTMSARCMRTAIMSADWRSEVFLRTRNEPKAASDQRENAPCRVVWPAAQLQALGRSCQVFKKT